MKLVFAWKGASSNLNCTRHIANFKCCSEFFKVDNKTINNTDCAQPRVICLYKIQSNRNCNSFASYIFTIFFFYFQNLKKSLCVFSLQHWKQIQNTWCNPCSMCANIAPTCVRWTFFIFILDWTRYSFFVCTVKASERNEKKKEKYLLHTTIVNKRLINWKTTKTESERPVHNFDNANYTINI